uniref:Uncharacterized protein n=1 Tax=Chromera velia CCMP2878 TaxID=1169474 RepID=A0A0G4GEV9_9ALVE|eukprot:Cvel_21563.t1-p1 / transcript=Cvel_21563.t1 / gene=Cvel_21563 / organism=Chromera_velia_CCMP2878 / gene_product=hypothetical protein / transcript_product=hypothetical protein / location=Cvel_scaffold2033:32644-35139(+) / protein_length=832 / sequence_SO=supercontig / SO=protein_coding / is_pseudo=false
MKSSPCSKKNISRPTNALLAKLLAPFLNKCFLLFASVCRDFHQVYTQQKREKTTSLNCFFEETETGKRSCRLNHLILCLKRDARQRGGKPPLQTLVSSRGGDLQIPAASLIVLLLNEAHKTPHALCATKTVASFFDLPPAALLLAHMDRPGDNCFSTVVSSLVKCGLPGDLRELRYLVRDVGLALSDVVKHIDENIAHAEAIRCINRGSTAQFRRFLERLEALWASPEDCQLPPLVRHWVRDLHRALCRRARGVGEGEGAAVQLALEDALACACVKTGRLEDPALWEDLAGRWGERGGGAKRLLCTYVKRLQACVLDEESGLDVAFWDSYVGRVAGRGMLGLDIKSETFRFHSIVSVLELVCLKTRFLEADSDLDEVRWGLVRALVSVFPVDELKRNDRGLKDAMTTILGTWCRPSWGAASVAWLRAFVGVMGASNFFRIFSPALRGFAMERLTEDRVRVCRYLTEVRVAAMGEPEGLGGQKLPSGQRGVFGDWAEVDFLVSVCGLPGDFILKRARLDRSVHAQAVSAGASPEDLEGSSAAVAATFHDSEDEDENGEPVSKIGWMAWGVGDVDEVWSWEDLRKGDRNGVGAWRDPFARQWAAGFDWAWLTRSSLKPLRWHRSLKEYSVYSGKMPSSDARETRSSLHVPREGGCWEGVAVVVSDDRFSTEDSLNWNLEVFNSAMEDSSFCSMVAAGWAVQEVLSGVCTHRLSSYEVSGIWADSSEWSDRWRGQLFDWDDPERAVRAQPFKRYPWMELLGVLFTLGLLHRCSCLRLSGDSIEGLKRVVSMEFPSEEPGKSWFGGGCGEKFAERPFLGKIFWEFLIRRLLEKPQL